MEKNKKITILEHAKSYIKHNHFVGICSSIQFSIRVNISNISILVDATFKQEFYPHLLKYKPSKITGKHELNSFWWSRYDKESRYKVIDSMIKDIEND